VQRRGARCRAAPPSLAATESLVTVHAVSKSHDGTKVLFEDLSFTLGRGERMAVIGANGSGKTSLLKLISGADWPDEGEVALRRNTQVGFLAQDAGLPDGVTAFEAVVQADSPIARTVRRYHELLVQGKQADKAVRALALLQREHLATISLVLPLCS
jgi:ABC transport system ATP-binding/permease protein